MTGPPTEPNRAIEPGGPTEPSRATEPHPACMVAEPRRRLHPLSPLVRGARVAVLAAAAISWQGYRDLGTWRWLLAVTAIAILVLLGSVVSWLVTGYHVVGRELRIYGGLVSRRTRAIPLERLQSVELVRPLFARLFGLAELRLEVVGASKTEAPLAFLTVGEATALRERLLTISRGGRAAAEASGGRAVLPSAETAPGQPGIGYPAPGGRFAYPEPGGPATYDPAAHGPVTYDPAAPRPGAYGPATRPAFVASEQRLHTIANRDLVISQLLRPHWWFLPLAIAAPVFFFVTGSDVSFVAVASTFTAVLGAVQAPVRALLNDWQFTIATAEDGLHVHRGLLETRSQTVPTGRVQAVGVQWPLLWRGHGWIRARMHIAGASSADENERRAGLLPVGTVPIAEAVIAEVLPGFVLRSVVVRGVPSRVGWIAPLRRFVLGYQLTDAAFVTRDGLLTRQLVIVGYGRIQSVRIRQGPLQRLLRVASVWVDTAGGGLEAVAPHRDVAEAVALATELAERSRAARRVAAVPRQPAPTAVPAPASHPVPPAPPQP